MDKALLGIHIPSSYVSFDAFVPLDTTIAELTEIIANGVSDLTDRRYVVSNLEMLCLKESDSLMNPQLTLRHYNVHDGMQIYLV